jgi:hypothetical protein
MLAAAVLDPVGHYQLRLHENNMYLRALEEAIERLAESVEDGVEAIRQIRTFISYERKFDGKLAKGAVGKMPAGKFFNHGCLNFLYAPSEYIMYLFFFCMLLMNISCTSYFQLIGGYYLVVIHQSCRSLPFVLFRSVSRLVGVSGIGVPLH